MQARFVQDGDIIDYTPTAPVAAGEVVVVGGCVAVSKLDIPANTLGALAMTGVYDVAKDSTTPFAFEQKVFWHTVDKKAVDAAGADRVEMGICILPAGASDATVRVRLN